MCVPADRLRDSRACPESTQRQNCASFHLLLFHRLAHSLRSVDIGFSRNLFALMQLKTCPQNHPVVGLFSASPLCHCRPFYLHLHRRLHGSLTTAGTCSRLHK
jgi:hypothetical protein